MPTQFKIHRLVIASLLITLGSVSVNAQSDVTQPGDPIIASSSNSPGSEGVANAIDNTQAKYLNFDTATDSTPPNIPSGFVVSPSVGVTRVIGMTIQSANDAPVRDPSTIRLEGSNDASVTGFNAGNWEVITELTTIPAFTARFERQTFFFDNFKAYRHYRWTVLAVASANDCCMQVAEVELLGSTLPPDVTQPGDPIIASSSNSPGSEGVANAIDNTQAKYLNFDTATDSTPPNIPSGFVVTPSIGRSIVTGMTIQSANDAPVRDPGTVRLEGSNDASVSGFNAGNWTVITEVTVPAFTARFQTQTILFDNYTPYRHYRWTVLTVASANDCCMQVAEVQLLGTGAPQDVTQPGDPIIASSSNSPGSEGVANAIDNTQAKYLNFDTATDSTPPNIPSGFVVSPSIGTTVVTGMTIQSANDAPVRDPGSVRLEGSNDASITGFNSGNWTLITEITVPAFTARFQTQEFFFANRRAYRHYRWTVLAVASANDCCMQVAEVQLLAATQSNPCGQTSFTEPPENTPALVGSPATFIAKVNGPWTVQWLRNGTAIPGATTLSYSTPPMTAAGDTNLYALAIVGCQTSQVVRATLFTPSATKSLAINFIGSGANGAPTSMETNDIAGVQAQAFWNNATGGTGSLPDGVNPFVNSDNADSTITFDFQSSGTWGAGTGTDSPTERMLNGLAGGNVPGTEISTFTFGNVPAGNHSLLIYAVSPPLQFQVVRYKATGAAEQSAFMRVLNSDEYKPAPGFYRGSSTNPAAPTVGNFVRFDNVQPAGGAGGTIVLEFETLTPGVDRETGVNGVQLVLNTTPVLPPIITTHPQPTVASNTTIARLSVTATGNDLSYQWRKNGRNLPNGGNVSGATSAQLTISNFGTNDVAIYSVAVFNPGGSVISDNASVRSSRYSITDLLVGHWKLDETSGTIAANGIAANAGGQPGHVNGTATWAAGKVANAFSFDGVSYIIVSNYTKAVRGIAGSAWVNIPAGSGTAMVVFQNAQPTLTISGGAGRIVGQFQLQLVVDPVDFTLRPEAAVGIGPNVARATGTTPFPTGWRHLAFTADGAQLRLYVDGQQVAVADYLADINLPDIPYITIGAALNRDIIDPTSVLAPDGTNPNLLTGLVDDIGLWTRALTADEVSRVFQAGSQGQALNTVVIPPPAPTTELKITSITLTGGNIRIEWTGGGVLQAAAAVNGPWQDVPGATSPFTFPPTAAQQFGRIIQR